MPREFHGQRSLVGDDTWGWQVKAAGAWKRPGRGEDQSQCLATDKTTKMTASLPSRRDPRPFLSPRPRVKAASVRSLLPRSPVCVAVAVWLGVWVCGVWGRIWGCCCMFGSGRKTYKLWLQNPCIPVLFYYSVLILIHQDPKSQGPTGAVSGSSTGAAPGSSP